MFVPPEERDTPAHFLKGLNRASLQEQEALCLQQGRNAEDQVRSATEPRLRRMYQQHAETCVGMLAAIRHAISINDGI
ncbi:MAG: hypothetical protein ABI240_17480 [Sphingomonas sp.]